MTPFLRLATPADLPAILAIEQECFFDSSWTAEDFSAYTCLVAEAGAEIAGFLVSYQTFAGEESSPPEREILNLAVAPRFRRLGIAAALLRNELERPGTHFLEVRESNVAAQTLYSGFGFVEIARRRSYYQDPVETAIVMKLKR